MYFGDVPAECIARVVGHDDTIKPAKILKPQSIFSGRHKRRLSKVVQIERKKTQPIVRKCLQENMRRYGTIERWDTIASVRRKTHKKTPQPSAIWEPVDLFKLQLQHPTRYQRVNTFSMPNGAAGDRWPSRKFLCANAVTSKEMCFLFIRTRSATLRSEREVCNNTLTFKHITCFQLHDASNLFSDSVALQLSQVFCMLLRKALDGSSPIRGALQSTSLSRHTCH